MKKIISSLINVPANVSFLTKTPNIKHKPININLEYNKKIFHTKCLNHVPKSYYEDYYMTASQSKTRINLQKQQIKQLCQYHKNPKSLIEIGCGDGSFLEYSKKIFPQILGIEPSKIFYEISNKKGFDVINQYVNHKFKLDKKFDIFVSRQVFEHIEHPTNVLCGIRNVLNDGAVGLIEVPNGYKALRNNRFYEFFPDHIQYYSVNSLVMLATRTGFNVISCNETLNGDYLELWLRYDYLSHQYITKLNTIKNNTIKLINDFINSHEKIVIYGAGAKTLGILSSLNKKTIEKIKIIIDDDEHKWNKYIPNTNIQITNANFLKTTDIKTILISALSFTKDIIENIKKYNKEFCIYTIDYNNNNRIIQI